MFVENKEAFFPEINEVEKSATIIKEELIAILSSYENIPKIHELDKLNKAISFDEGPGWRTFYLKTYGGWFKQNCERCRKTYKLFEGMNNISSVMFSIMEPGNNIPPHTGKFAGVFRYHLPLIVPGKGKCEISVGGQVKEYNENQSIMFDDTNEHFVVNESDSFRAVLYLDIDKKAGFITGLVNHFFMKLIYWSPKFKEAVKKSFKNE